MNKSKNFFPDKESCNPIIYIFKDTNSNFKNYIKIGYTTRSIEERMKEIYNVKMPSKNYEILFTGSAVRDDCSVFKDYEVHKYLKKMNVKRISGEWFECDVKQAISAYEGVRLKKYFESERTKSFTLRPEQISAIEKTKNFFINEKKKNQSPKFLWNAKMRFGKTFTAYELCRQMNFKKILIMTFKPVVESAWRDDLLEHVNFDGWQFISRNSDLTFENANKDKPIVCFGSFQDFLGVDKTKDTIQPKPKNKWIHEIQWDIVIFDEYHYGAWRDSAKKLFEEPSEDEILDDSYYENENQNLLDETWLPITSDFYLYLSGTPFRALKSGEFVDDQIFNWTYSDEQKAKLNCKNLNNPYEELPRMVMLTYEIPESIKNIAIKGETNEFDINLFFSATGNKDSAHFIYENEVQKWLDLIRGSYLENFIDELKVGTKKNQSYLPYKETKLLNVLTHTLWFLPSVSSCYAMSNLLKKSVNKFYHDYKIIVCAGKEVGDGIKSFEYFCKEIDNPLKSKSITLTCGKLTTGVTVPEWTGIFMLRNLSSPETYFQAAFRVQSPWVIFDENNKKIILKKECYIFDFAIHRALKQIADYSCKLDYENNNPVNKVEDFINFLPVLAYSDGMMREINAEEILDIAMSGISSSLLARRWESALLVNVDNFTLKKILNSKEVMDILSRIKGFRSLNDDILMILNTSEKIKKIKKESKHLSNYLKNELSDEEKEYKKKRKDIQSKLIKFAARIPVFMYLTDFREYTLKDVITKLEPALFKKVTGIDVKDFSLLESMGIFNGPLMNEAVYKFKSFEDSSISYSGIDKHIGEKIGGFDTVLSEDEYKSLYSLQQESLKK